MYAYKHIIYTLIETHTHKFLHKEIIMFKLDLFNNRA